MQIDKQVNEPKKWFLSFETLEALDSEYSGLCLACGSVKSGDTEPDAKRYECETCGEKKVYGSHWLPYCLKVEITDEKEENIVW